MTDIETEINDVIDIRNWRRNVRGTLSREYGETTVSIFCKWGNYRWVITGSEPIYSPKGYATEDDAMFSLAKELLY